MTLGEYAAWTRHFDRHPPGDTNTQRLLARIGILLVAWATGGKRQVSTMDVAPWLVTRKERDQDKKARKRQIRRAALDAARKRRRRRQDA